MIAIDTKKALLLSALCACTCGFVGEIARAQEAPPVAVAATSGADLLRDAHAALATPFDYALNTLAPAEKLERQREAVARNAPALALARRALRAGVKFPLPKSPEEDFGELWATARELARQFTYEAAARAADGDAMGAARSNLDALELGVQTGHGVYLSALSGFAIAEISRRSLQEHAALLNAAQSREVAANWEERAARTVEFSQILRNESEVSAAFMRSNKAMIDFDNPLQRLLGLFEVKQALADGDLTPAEADEMLEAMKFSLDDMLGDLRVGFDKSIVRAQTPYFAAARAAPIAGDNPNTAFILKNVDTPRTRLSFERDKVNNRLLVAALRLRAAKLETGAYPANYDAGVDPFSPTLAPLIYKRAGDSYVLYSVGPDGKDEGGAEIQTLTTDRETGAKKVSDRLSPDSFGDITAPVL